MNRNFDLGLIRTFVRVADHGGMAVAANSLHLTQGAVSQQVKRLEDLLDCLLFRDEGVRRSCAFRPAVLGALADKGIVWRTVFDGESPMGGSRKSRTGVF
ncbi:MAG: LysR family transcriptional regulator [Janthinobacterium lividum]